MGRVAVFGEKSSSSPGKFNGHASCRSHRRRIISQSFGNKANSEVLQVPKGSRFEKNILMKHDFKKEVSRYVIHCFDLMRCFLILYEPFAKCEFSFRIKACENFTTDICRIPRSLRLSEDKIKKHNEESG